MTEAVAKNFSAIADLDAIPKFDRYVECMFAQQAPAPGNRGHRLWPSDDTPRIFIRCNLINCEVPPGSQLTNCNTTVVEMEVLDAEVDTVVLNGSLVHTRPRRKNVVHGHYRDDGTFDNSSAAEGKMR